jgi:hypothetical protein
MKLDVLAKLFDRWYSIYVGDDFGLANFERHGLKLEIR